MNIIPLFYIYLSSNETVGIPIPYAIAANIKKKPIQLWENFYKSRNVASIGLLYCIEKYAIS